MSGALGGVSRKLVYFVATDPHAFLGVAEAPALVSEEVLNIKQLAERLQLSERTVYRLANTGEIPGFRVGKAWRFPRTQVDEWMAQEVEKARRPSPKRQAKGKSRLRRPGLGSPPGPSESREEDT